MQDSALLLSGSINANNDIVAQSVAGLNEVTLSTHSLDLGVARDIGEGRALFLKAVSASGASAEASTNYTAYSATIDYVRGEKCSLNGNDYNCIAATKGHAPPDSHYWELVPDSVEIQLIAASDAALSTNVAVLTTSGPIIVYPPFVKSTIYSVGKKVNYGAKNYNCIAPTADYPDYTAKDYEKDDEVSYNNFAYICIKNTTTKQPPTNTTYWKLVSLPNPTNPDYWDEIGVGLSDGFTTYLPIPPQMNSRGKRYLGVRYLNIGKITGASFTAEIITEVSDPKKFYPSGFSV